MIGNGRHGGHEHGFFLDLNQCIDTDNNGNPDNDGDGLCDNWETEGIDFDQDGVVDLQLYDVNKNGVIDASEKADINHKDIYVEIDWMALHQPLIGALQRVIRSFANAPVANPDGTTGIRLHILVDEEAVAHQRELSFVSVVDGLPSDFDETKKTHFGTASERAEPNAKVIIAAKRLVFRYALYVHSLPDLPDGRKNTTSGKSEIAGNDLMISLGGWSNVGGHPRGNADHQASTFMHELGHTLGLRHGGIDNVNCKPNYLSIMSYSLSFDGNPVVGRPLDYSRRQLPTLNEDHLNEPAGIQGPAGLKTSYRHPVLPRSVPRKVVPADQPIDWNLNGKPTDLNVAVDITGDCDTTGESVLRGAEDWNHLQYSFRTSLDFADGAHPSVVDQPPELTLEQALTMSPDSDGDGVTNLLDNCITVANPNQEDGDQNGIGDACDAPPRCATNVTTQVSVTRGGYRRNSTTGRFVQQVSLRNLGTAAVPGPMALVLDGLSANATAFNAAGNTDCAAPRSAYVFVNVGNDNVLTSGETANSTLEFTNPTNAGIGYTPRVLAGDNR